MAQLILKEKNSEDFREKFYLISENRFEEVNYCETYDAHGQEIGCTNAGCNTYNNDYIEADSLDVEEHAKVRAYTYWNGHNWKSVIIEDLNFAIDAENYEEVDNSISSKILSEYEIAKTIKEEHGKTIKESENYFFVESFVQSFWADAEVFPKNDWTIDELTN